MMRRALLAGLVGLFLASSAHAQTWRVCEPIGVNGYLMCLDEADTTPLNARIPLILIHGWAVDGEPHPEVWSNARGYLAGLPWISEKFKLYLVSYRSNEVSVDSLSRIFARLLDRKDVDDQVFSKRQVVIIAYSMGGLIARSFMETERLRDGRAGGDRVLRLVTLGTPHHGTPVANGPARDDKAGSLVSLLVDVFDNGLFNRSLDWSSYNRYDLHWDNHDDWLDYERFRPDDNYWLRAMNARRVFRNKLSVYGGVISMLDGVGRCLDFDFGCGAAVMRQALDVENDGLVPVASSSFEACGDCAYREILRGYDHHQIVSGVGPKDSNLFGAIVGELSELVYAADRRFNSELHLGNATEEAFHNLRGWTAPGAGFRDLVLDQTNSVDLFIGDLARDPEFVLTSRSISCENGYTVSIGNDLTFRFKPYYPGETETLMVIVDKRYFPKGRVRVKFVNNASDNCGGASIMYVGVKP